MQITHTHCFVCGKSLDSWVLTCPACKMPCCSEDCRARHHRRHLFGEIFAVILAVLIGVGIAGAALVVSWSYR